MMVQVLVQMLELVLVDFVHMNQMMVDIVGRLFLLYLFFVDPNQIIVKEDCPIIVLNLDLSVYPELRHGISQHCPR